ncbi:MAG TPA: winged helix-turn-helix domain-containing protein [Clostridia bacterium]|nr:winged helix-turn-helix domain-containing protein [Clostridia bacterium]
MNSSSSLHESIRFGPFECDVLARELRRKGHRVKIQDQPFQVLTMLLQATGAMVSREQIRHALWPADTFVDFENGLNRAICKLREVLDDKPTAPKYIQTVNRYGYRFIGVIAGTVRLAVLPFTPLSGDTTNELFADGISEEVIGQLGKVGPQQLRVIARTSVMQYKGTRENAAQIGHELDVDYILEGSVRESDHRVRVTVQLVAVADQAHVWSDSYDCEMTDSLTAQADIASRVRHSLSEHFCERNLRKRASVRTIVRSD